MSLESGQYYVYTADGDFPVGRRSVEDKSLNPKGIFKLPEGTAAPVVSNVSCTPCLVSPLTSALGHPFSFASEQWDVEKLDNGNYNLKNRGAIVGGIVGLLFAFLLPNQASLATTEWTLERDVRNASEHAYM